eukprot:3088149-Prymnesium_polylepis.1
MARQRTRQSGSAGTGTGTRQHDVQARDGELEGVAASPVAATAATRAVAGAGHGGDDDAHGRPTAR